MVTLDQIKNMNYVDFMAEIDEVNRPPGGKQSIAILLQNTFLRPESKVLDVGCNTGFVTFEIASVVGSFVTGLDISENMIKTANNFLDRHYKNLKNRVNFMVGDAMKLPFPDNSFDLVVSGGSTVFVNSVPKAITEYSRVVKPWGFIGDINFYFHKNPPNKLIERLNSLVGINIQKWDINYWINNYKKTGLEIYFYSENKAEPVTDLKILDYCSYLVKDKDWSSDVKEYTRKRLIDIYKLFNEEHKYLAYSVFVLRKRTFEEVILF